MSTQKAVVIQGPKEAKLVTDRPIPKLRDGYILVKTVAVALNPTDWKHIDFMATEGALVGCDYAGTVEEVGKGVTKQWKKGDKICGFAHGSDKVQLENGTFAEHIVVKGDIQMRMPENMSFEDASTLGVGILTVGQGIYQTLKVPLPTEPAKESKPILIYGGSTATGSLAIQFVKLSGYTPITTCSPRNFDLVEKLGAAAAFNYNDVDCAKQINQYTNNNLKLAWDTISLPQSAQICADALSSTSGGHYASLLGVQFPRKDVETGHTLAYTSCGEAFTIRGTDFPAKPDDFEFAKMWTGIVDGLLKEGRFEVHSPKVGSEGLKGVLDGLQLLREEKVSGQKLVYRVADTP